MEYQSYITERLELRPTHIDDATLILELLNSPKWIKYIGDRNVKTIEDAVTYIKIKMLPQLKRLGYGNFTMIRKSDGIKIGTCGLYDRDGLDGVDIGFALLPQYERKGYGYEAAEKILKVGLEELKITSISGITTHDNIASQKLLQKLGLEYKETIMLPNDPEELLLYNITNEKVS